MISGFITSQEHSDDQLDQVLQTYKHINELNLKWRLHIDK